MKRTLPIMLALVLMIMPALAFSEGTGIFEYNFDAPDDTLSYPDWESSAWIEDEGEYVIEPREREEGGYALYMAANASANDARFGYTLTVEPDSFYKLVCDIKTVGVTGGAGANISVGDTLAASAPLLGDNDWTYTELIGQTGAEQTEMTVMLRLGGYGALSNGEAYFDDVKAEKLEDYSGEAASFDASDTGGDDSGEPATIEEIPGIGYMMTAMLFTAVLGYLFYRRLIVDDNSLSRTYAKTRRTVILIAILLAGVALRVLLSLKLYGHETDISCFMAWADTVASGGISNFYTSGTFADYPPGYMYVLFLIGKLASALRLTVGSDEYALLVKLPAMISDVLTAVFVYSLAKKREGEKEHADIRTGELPLALAAAVMFTPLIAFISGGWGQIDSILSLLLVLTVWLFTKDKLILAGLIYGVAIITKPQALMIGPLLAVAYIVKLKDTGLKNIWKTVLAVAAAVAAIFALSLPFKSTQEPLWFIDKLLGTASSYPYASIEAFNLFALFGGNWASVDSTFLLATYRIWGITLMALSIVASAIFYIKGRKSEKHALTLTVAYLIVALFSLGHYMHERYMFPALILLIVAFIMYRDRRIFMSFFMLSTSALLNAMLALVIVSNQEARGTLYSILTAIGSILNLAGFAYLTWTVWDICVKKRKRPAFAEKKPEKKAVTLPNVTDTKLHYTKTDKLVVSILTAVYMIVALVNLGTTVAPESYYIGRTGDVVTVTLPEKTDIYAIRVYGGLYTGTVRITNDAGEEFEYTEENSDMFRWIEIAGENTASSFTIEVTEGEVWFNELAVFDSEGKYVSATASGTFDPENEHPASALFDEPDQVPLNGSYMYGMYFDELYHARTAYEHLHGIAPYENSHPPLGKIFIMLGIAVFGMNAFGWRIVGALFGVAMVPVMYAFAKRLFKKTEFALLASGLFAFDFMHYTQTRIATIDVYGVFFIILMMYYMYRYYELNFFSDGLKKTLRPLALGGLFFGLGAASKWICFYAGGGMAVLLALSLISRYREYAELRKSGTKEEREAVAPFWKNTVLTLLWCCVFYLAVPIAIYILSYLPYMLSEARYDLEGIWGVQEFMFNYHSGLKATHAYQSAWWQWPLSIRPMWYYVNYEVPAGAVGTISAMGNPAVWWPSTVLTGIAIAKLIAGKIKADAKWTVLTVSLASCMLPWMLVTRCTFIYHFFASVPFIILIGVGMLERKETAILEMKDAKLRDKLYQRYSQVKWIWLAAAVGLFILFYPAITGTIISRNYIASLEWLPSWTFLGG